MVTDEPICQNCEYWVGHPISDTRIVYYCRCSKINSSECFDVVEDEAVLCSYEEANFVTGRNFGCVHFTKAAQHFTRRVTGEQPCCQ